uniref:Uncharacterized protein n=1 Tax=Nelumbo nucifera TaxID=4432 RepID=A0A822Y9M0_NELNU|nr:TPA_asm: hypothetical protein HUJ06_029427 [Nelumbo nucifera]
MHFLDKIILEPDNSQAFNPTERQQDVSRFFSYFVFSFFIGGNKIHILSNSSIVRGLECIKQLSSITQIHHPTPFQLL